MLATIVASAAVLTYLLVIIRQSAGGEIDDLGRVVVVTGLLVCHASAVWWRVILPEG